MPNALSISTPTDTTIEVSREFNAPADLVFDCWTIPALIRRWLGAQPGWAMTTCEFDAKPGGRWRFVYTGPGVEMGSSGVIKEITRPGRIVMTETYDMDWTGGETLVTNLIKQLAPRRTVSTITILYSSKAARDGARATPMAVGMEAGFKVLDVLLGERQTT